jgi:hypothetical protein
MTRKHEAATAATLALLLGLVAVPEAARAGDYFSPTDEHVSLSLGAMYVSSATAIRADSSAGVVGTDLNAEDQLGLRRSNVEPKFEATVRADTRQRLSFDYFTLDRSGSAVVKGSDIVFRNVVFIPGDPLETQLSLRTLGITYEYSFWHSETLELAGTLGLHATDVSTTAKVNTATRHIIQEEDQAGPIPTVGINATWVVSRRFYLNARGQYLTAHIQNISGSLGIYEFDALYRLRPNVSFGLGYTEIRAHLASEKATQGGLFNFDTHGPELFVRVAF